MQSRGSAPRRGAHVVGHGCRRACQIAVVVEIVDDVFGHGAVVVGQAEVAQLRFKRFGQGLAGCGSGHVVVRLVGAPAGFIACEGHIVVVAVVGALQLFGALFELLAALAAAVAFGFALDERGVLIDHAAHLVLDFGRRHLKQTPVEQLLRVQALLQTLLLRKFKRFFHSSRKFTQFPPFLQLRAGKVFKVPKVFKVFKVSKVLKVFKDSKDSKDFKDLRDFRDVGG